MLPKNLGYYGIIDEGSSTILKEDEIKSFPEWMVGDAMQRKEDLQVHNLKFPEISSNRLLVG